MQNDFPKPPAKQKRKLILTLLVILTLAALAMVIIPAWIVQPFKRETPEGLTLAYTLKRWSPIVTLLDSAIVLIFVVWLWRGARRWWRKTALVITLILTFTAAWLARQNHFEWIFNPITEVAYTAPDEAKAVDDSDKVLAIEINHEAVAYPIRQMAYHHVVNDVVGGVPIAATY